MKLETKIKNLIAAENFPEGTEFKVVTHGLMRSEGGGWETNDSHYLTRDPVSLETVLEMARGRWETFKVNYLPRARVSDIVNAYESGGDQLLLEVDFTSFLTIEAKRP
jgi:hypothetical protein